MKENTETIIAMLEELLTVSKSRQASQSGCTNMDITSIKALIEEAGRRNHERTEAELAKFAHGIVDCLNTVNNRIDRIARREQPDFGEIRQLLEQTDEGEASPESISWLENLFEFNRDNGKIKQMRKDVETYEEAVRRQAASSSRHV